ncbi:MAG TPA: hypothetical protein DCL13_03485 [Peptococcaceae bacterium]|nr:hypothetical protein [Peptococcaceae bacterium]
MAGKAPIWAATVFFSPITLASCLMLCCRGLPFGLPEWLRWIRRWEESSTLAPATRRQIRLCLYKVGRWLQTHHPEVTNPQQWTRELGLEWVPLLIG